ncbi:MAG: hypothetical protein ACK5V3_13445 [Bdellovibrionales bacterium]
MRKNLVHLCIQFLLITLLSSLIIGCSVSSSGQKYSSLPSEPSDSSPQEPDHQSPVLVTAPVTLIPDEVTVPSEPPSQPQLVDIVQPDPEMPPMLIIDETPVTSPPSINPDAGDETTPTVDMEDPVASEEEVSPSLVDAVEQIEFDKETEEVPRVDDSEEVGDTEETGVTDEVGDTEEVIEIGAADSDEQESGLEPEIDEPTEVIVQGSCFGKSKAALMFSNKNSKSNGKFAKKMKSRVVNCEKGLYKIRIKGKKKHLQQLEVQAAYY